MRKPFILAAVMLCAALSATGVYAFTGAHVDYPSELDAARKSYRSMHLKKPNNAWIAAATLLTMSLTGLCIVYLDPRKKKQAAKRQVK